MGAVGTRHDVDGARPALRRRRREVAGRGMRRGHEAGAEEAVSSVAARGGKREAGRHGDYADTFMAVGRVSARWAVHGMAREENGCWAVSA